jgi:hypothetical protein
MSSQNRIGVILAAVVVASIAALAFNRNTTAAAETSLGDVSVSCGSSHRAVVQRTGSGDAAQINVQCVEAEGLQPSSNAMFAAGPLAPVASAVVPAVSMPAVMYQSAPPYTVQVAPLPAAAPVPSTPARRAERKPSLQKRLLIIGGSSGVGAGVGALVGGKKGALIGAAIAGGGATIVDQVKHR